MEVLEPLIRVTLVHRCVHVDDLFWFEGELGRTPVQDEYGGGSLGAVTAHLNSRVDKRPRIRQGL